MVWIFHYDKNSVLIELPTVYDSYLIGMNYIPWRKLGNFQCRNCCNGLTNTMANIGVIIYPFNTTRGWLSRGTFSEPRSCLWILRVTCETLYSPRPLKLWLITGCRSLLAVNLALLDKCADIHAPCIPASIHWQIEITLMAYFRSSNFELTWSKAILGHVKRCLTIA